MLDRARDRLERFVTVAGDRYHDGAAECAVRDYAGGGRGDWGDGDVRAGGGAAERERVRLLEPGDCAAYSAVTRYYELYFKIRPRLVVVAVVLSFVSDRVAG